jgi:hypothetical protein
MPVKDVLTITDRAGTKLIKVSDLLANDRDWQGEALHITTTTGFSTHATMVAGVMFGEVKGKPCQRQRAASVQG